jgi:uncharacterized protein YecE (DUF72 family)
LEHFVWCSKWALQIKQWLDDGMDVFAMFNNDLGGMSAVDAAYLQSQVKSLRGQNIKTDPDAVVKKESFEALLIEEEEAV